jgi:hypothetical protein
VLCEYLFALYSLKLDPQDGLSPHQLAQAARSGQTLWSRCRQPNAPPGGGLPLANAGARIAAFDCGPVEVSELGDEHDAGGAVALARRRAGQSCWSSGKAPQIALASWVNVAASRARAGWSTAIS